MQVLYECPKAKVTAASAIIHGQKFSINDILEISAHDEYNRMWKKSSFFRKIVLSIYYNSSSTSGLYFIVTTKDGKAYEFNDLTTQEIRLISRALAEVKKNQTEIPEPAS